MFDWKKFVKAGRALFTVENVSTGQRFTYKVTKHREKELWFVGVLSGPNNNADYQYVGIISNNEFRLTRRSRLTENALSYQVFKWLMKFINSDEELSSNYKVYHEGRCGVCGRLLTVPQSIEYGFGPICIVQRQTHIPLKTAKQIQKLLKLNRRLNYDRH